MSFVQNGSFEALAQASANTNNTSTDSNPFGLKDFARVLDAKFGNSAFSDNLLAAPSGTIKSTNPFDRQAMDKIDSSPYQGGRTAVKKQRRKRRPEAAEMVIPKLITAPRLQYLADLIKEQGWPGAANLSINWIFVINNLSADFSGILRYLHNKKRYLFYDISDMVR